MLNFSILMQCLKIRLLCTDQDCSMDHATNDNHERISAVDFRTRQGLPLSVSCPVRKTVRCISGNGACFLSRKAALAMCRVTSTKRGSMVEKQWLMCF